VLAVELLCKKHVLLVLKSENLCRPAGKIKCAHFIPSRRPSTFKRGIVLVLYRLGCKKLKFDIASFFEVWVDSWLWENALKNAEGTFISDINLYNTTTTSTVLEYRISLLFLCWEGISSVLGSFLFRY